MIAGDRVRDVIQDKIILGDLLPLNNVNDSDNLIGRNRVFVACKVRQQEIQDIKAEINAQLFSKLECVWNRNWEIICGR